jgi:hypothetical protein
VDDCRSHIVVTTGRAVAVTVFLEDGCVGLGAKSNLHIESMRFRDRCHRLEKFTARDHAEFLLCAVRPRCRDARRDGVWRGAACRAQAEARRDSVLKHLQKQIAESRCDGVRFLVSVLIVPAMAATVMMTAAAQEPGAGDIHGESDTGNRNRFSEMNLHGGENASDGFVANQERNHGEHDGTGEAGEIAKLARAKGEVGIFRMSARVRIGQRG